MLELYLRFVDRGQADAVLASLGILPLGGQYPADGIAASGIRYALDVVFASGILMTQTGETAQTEWGPTPLHAQQSGYHVNVVWRDTSVPVELAAFAVTPAYPKVRWATA